MKTIEERFWAKVHKGDGCWEWIAGRRPGGYGAFCVRHGVNERAHRFSWILANGPIPGGMMVCHTCDNPPCVNPAHLFLGDHRDNARDMVSKGRHYQATKPHLVARGDRNGSRLHPDRLRRGETQHLAVLTADDVSCMRALHGAGASRGSLVDVFGVSKAAVAQVLTRKTWRHVR